MKSVVVMQNNVLKPSTVAASKERGGEHATKVTNAMESKTLEVVIKTENHRTTRNGAQVTPAGNSLCEPVVSGK